MPLNYLEESLKELKKRIKKRRLKQQDDRTPQKVKKM